MIELFSKEYWQKKRAEYLQCARECKEILTDQGGHWSYQISDERLKDAMQPWVDRAKNAHAFALGRKPVICNFYYQDEKISYKGNIYAE